jgi:hypothetical protein
VKCRCGAHLLHQNRLGEPIVRNKGIVLKADGIVLVCPKCGGDVPFSPDLAKAMQNSLVLFFGPGKRPAA